MSAWDAILICLKFLKQSTQHILGLKMMVRLSHKSGGRLMQGLHIENCIGRSKYGHIRQSLNTDGRYGRHCTLNIKE